MRSPTYLVLVATLVAAVASLPPGVHAAPAAEEQELVEEIMLLEVQLQRAAQEVEDLDRQAASLEEEIARTRRAMAGLEQELGAKQGELARWLQFQYRHGFTPYLAVLLKATSFTDFLTRQQLLGSITRRGMDLLADTEYLLARQQEHEEAISRQRAEVDRKKEEAGRTLARITELLDEKSALLAQARAAGHAAAVETGRRWEEDLPNLHYLLRHFSQLPWKAVEPQSVEIDYRLMQARATVTAQGLTRAMAADPKLRNFQVEIASDQVVIKGRAPDFRLAGRATAQDNRIYFTPQELTWSGLQVGAQVLQELTKGYDLYFTFPEVVPGLKLRHLEQGDGYFLLILGF